MLRFSRILPTCLALRFAHTLLRPFSILKTHSNLAAPLLHISNSCHSSHLITKHRTQVQFAEPDDKTMKKLQRRGSRLCHAAAAVDVTGFRLNALEAAAEGAGEEGVGALPHVGGGVFAGAFNKRTGKVLKKTA